MKFLALLLLLSGCTAINQQLSPEIFYKRDMIIKVDGNEYTGVAVLPFKTEYDFTFTSAGKMSMFLFTSCHREMNIENAKTGWIFPDKKSVKIKYNPSIPLENKNCQIFLSALDVSGKHSFGMLDIIEPELSLPAKLSCNGEKSLVNGSSICQSKQYLLQTIEFPVDVVIAGNCKLPTTEDNKLFIFKIQPKICTYSAIEKQSPNRKFRFLTIGYEQVLLRENP